MNIKREHTDKADRKFRDNPFAKSYKSKMESHDFVRRNQKVEALKAKKK